MYKWKVPKFEGQHQKRLLSILQTHFYMILAGLLTAQIVLSSFWNERNQADRSIEKYVSLWEDDISRENLLQASSGLKEKIVKQIYELHSAIEAVTIQDQDAQCGLGSTFVIRYGVLPSGFLRVCYSANDLLWQSLFSPIFVGGLILLMSFTALALRNRYQSLAAQQSLEAELNLNRELARISRQVAHDIRGPLTALQALAHLSHEMSDEKKDLMNLALERIKGIANDLLIRANFKNRYSDKEESADLRRVLKDVLTQYKVSFPEAEMTLEIQAQQPEVLVSLSSIRIYRMLSNLLNNSLESIQGKAAEIQIIVTETMDRYCLQVIDNGCGIPSDVLARLSEEGFSYNKINGSGLGLFDAKKSMYEVGGELQIQSKLGLGTHVTLAIPKVSSCSSSEFSSRRA